MHSLVYETASMSPRSIRRAAERKAAKQARKLNSGTEDYAASSVNPSISPAQLTANRKNAQLSTGPTSDAGKRTSSLNAVKTGLTGRTVLLPADDAEIYRRHLAAYEAEYKPVGLRECELVQSLADTQWRLNRIPGLEAGIYALGHVEFGETCDPELVGIQTHLKYEKQLRNLHIQEARLVRRYQTEMAELRALQEQRHDEMASNLQTTCPAPLTRTAHSKPEMSASSIRLDTPAKVSSAPVPRPHADSFALLSSACGNFPGPASVD